MSSHATSLENLTPNHLAINLWLGAYFHRVIHFECTVPTQVSSSTNRETRCCDSIVNQISCLHVHF